MIDNEKLILNVSYALSMGASGQDIHSMLIEANLSENDAYLTYVAGKLLFQALET